MRYTPKHNSAKNSTAGRKVAGVALVGAATVGAGVSQASGASAASGSVWDRVAACESSGNWSIANGNGFQGGLQFTQQTWSAYGGGQYAGSANQASREQQIAVAQKVLAGQGPGAWPVCSVKAGLTSGNGGSSSAPAATTQTSRSTARSALTYSAAPKTTRHFVTKSAPAAGVQAPAAGVQAPAAGTHVASKHSLLVVDGILGPRTARALQAQVGTFQDGIVGPKTKAALQAWVGVYQDGVIGKSTVAALQAKLGILQDGSDHLNARTVRALQAYLNNH